MTMATRSGAQRRPARWPTRAAVATAVSLLLGGVGCSKAFWGGTAAGVAGAGALYEYSNKEQIEELERDYEHGEISRDEYLRRRREIEDRSVVY